MTEIYDGQKVYEELDEQTVSKELESRYGEATELLQDEDKMERFLQKLEKKLRKVPVAGNKLATIPVLVSLVKSYTKKEYTEVPLGSIVAILAALIYFVSPIDLIPDVIPVIGYLDDAAVIAGCLKLVETDLEDYQEWREKNGKVLDV